MSNPRTDPCTFQRGPGPPRRRWRRVIIAAAVLALPLAAAGTTAWPASAATSYTVTATIGVGTGPAAVGVDPSTPTAYVPNLSDGTMSVITAAVPRSTSTAVTCSPGTVAVGQPTSCTATVTDTGTGTASTPTGSVAFGSDTSGGSFSPAASCTLSPAGTAGQATCSVTYTPGQEPQGPLTITAAYSGDPGHATISGTTNATVTTRTTTTRVLPCRTAT